LPERWFDQTRHRDDGDADRLVRERGVPERLNEVERAAATISAVRGQDATSEFKWVERSF